jgi:hypothetical protein
MKPLVRRVRENGLKGLATQYEYAKMATGLATIPKRENMKPYEGKHETLSFRSAKGENMKPYEGKHETPKGKT